MTRSPFRAALASMFAAAAPLAACRRAGIAQWAKVVEDSGAKVE